jgi:hypothetical protein
MYFTFSFKSHSGTILVPRLHDLSTNPKVRNAEPKKKKKKKKKQKKKKTSSVSTILLLTGDQRRGGGIEERGGRERGTDLNIRTLEARETS